MQMQTELKRPHEGIHGFFEPEDEEAYQYLINEIPDGGSHCEVGLYHAKSLVFFLDGVQLAGKFINTYGVDPYNYPMIFRTMIKTGMGDRWKLLRTTSEIASYNFVENSLDSVYIDACHKFESVVRDIRLYLPKVKPGGLMLLHDIHLQSVANAVECTVGTKNGFVIGRTFLFKRP